MLDTYGHQITYLFDLQRKRSPQKGITYRMSVRIRTHVRLSFEPQHPLGVLESKDIIWHNVLLVIGCCGNSIIGAKLRVSQVM
jgi:hypothetical protein